MRYGPNRLTGVNKLLYVVVAVLLAVCLWLTWGCSSVRSDKCKCKCQTEKCKADCSADCGREVEVPLK